MGDTPIQWTDKSWSPLRVRVKADAAEIARSKGYTSLVQIAGDMAGHVGPHCEHVSEGCKLCYSGTNNARCLPANGTGLPFDRRSRDLVEPLVDEKILIQPLKWRKPQRVFVENQSDLFGEWNTDEQIDRVFAVMALSPQHTFQVLTKRPERMLDYLTNGGNEDDESMCDRMDNSIPPDTACHANMGAPERWPLPNVHIGVSVENQEQANARIPLLLQTPAALRFMSVEPLLGPVDLRHWVPNAIICDACFGVGGAAHICEGRIDWVIVGGESGAGARPCNTEWIQSIVNQCQAARVPVFVKQLGAHVIQGGERRRKKDRKGGNMHEWPHDLRVREFPNV